MSNPTDTELLDGIAAGMDTETPAATEAAEKAREQIERQTK